CPRYDRVPQLGVGVLVARWSRAAAPVDLPLGSCARVASLIRMREFFALAALGALACGKPPLQPSDPTPGAPHFTVMTYNVEFHSAGKVSTLDAIGAKQPDVVALQEMTPGMEAEIRETYAELYPFQLFDSAGGTDGLAVLSRYELIDRGVHPGPGGWHPAWHVDVAIPGVSLQLLNVHLRSLLTGNSGALES